MIARHEYIGRVCGAKTDWLVNTSLDSVPDTIACKRCGAPNCVADLSFDWGSGDRKSTRLNSSH